MELKEVSLFFRRQVKNIPGWHTRRKLVVIESDDWGSIRMPSLSSFDKLEKSGLDLRSQDAERYNLKDNLETEKDLGNLFEVLSTYKDNRGSYAVFTPVTIVANPDFNKIKNSGFSEYFYEPFTETLKRYPGCNKSFELWMEGIEKRIFVPQMHGREHLNVKAWMRALKNGDKFTRLAFDEGLWGFVPKGYPEIDYQAAFLLNDPSDLDYHKQIIKEGLDLFEKLFGYRAKYFVPPNGSFNNILNDTLARNGIKFRCTSRIQYEPLGNYKYKRVVHWLGQKDNDFLRYITRNCLFEPSLSGKDWVDSCLHEIEIAFRWHKPAVISSHRVNYIGGLNPKNRDIGLNKLNKLIKTIIKKWPGVEFITSDQLGNLF